MVFDAYPGEQRDLRWVPVTLTIIATLLLFCRLTATIKNRGWLGLEDALVSTAYVFLVVFAAMIYRATTYGFGMRVVDIERTGGNLLEAMKFFWLTQSFYALANGFNKMAFIALYYHVFPLPRFRQACIVLMAISIAWTVSYLTTVIFQCTPVPRAYDRTIPGTCINFFMHHWSYAISNLSIDIIVFILPIPVILRLNMSIGSRISLVILFCLGFFICLITALRMTTLPLSLRTEEPSWESAPISLWSFIESATGIICACLISLRRSIRTLWPKRWQVNNGASSGENRYGRSDRPSGNVSRGSRLQYGTETENTGPYSLSDVKRSKKGVRETYTSISLTESQEQIIGGAETEAQVTVPVDD